MNRTVFCILGVGLLVLCGIGCGETATTRNDAPITSSDNSSKKNPKSEKIGGTEEAGIIDPGSKK